MEMNMFNVRNFGNALSDGMTIGNQTFEAGRKSALADFYKTQGADLIAGDKNALAAYAQFDPQGALSIQNALADNRRADEQLGMQRDRLSMDREAHGFNVELTRERIAAIRRESADAAREIAARMDAAELERDQQILAGIVSGARAAMANGPEAWEQYKATIPPDAWRESGIDPASLTFRDAPAALARVVGTLEGIEEARLFSEGIGPQPVQPDYITLNGQLVDRAAPGGPAVVDVPGLMPAGPQTVVNNNMGEQSRIGTIPQGFALVPDPNDPSGYRMQRIPGGPEDQTAANERRQGARDTATSVIVPAAQRALDAAQNRTLTGVVGRVASMNPANLNAEVYRQVDVLKGLASVQALQQMREASPTGGALGSVTERELAMLEGLAGALDPASPNFERDLSDYTRTLLRTVHGPQAGDAIFAQSFPDADAPAQPTSSGIPDFRSMSDEELDAFIRERGGR